jgi:hypothetical protein
MARSSQIRDLIFLQNGEPVTVASFNYTTSPGFFALPASDAEGGPVWSPAGQQREGVDLLLQATTQVYIRFLDSASGPAVSAQTGIQLQPNVPFQICPKSTRQGISIVGIAAGVLNVFAIR